MKNKIYLLTGMLIIGLQGLHAQADKQFWNTEMKKIATETSNADWINIKPDTSINPLTFFINHKKALGLGESDYMVLYKTEKDKALIDHYRYNQFYKGYKIFGGEFLLHARGGKLLSANGKMIRGLNKNPAIIISKEEALQKAKQFFPAAQYAWEISELENNYKLILHDANASYKPKGELEWVSTEEGTNMKNPSKFTLAFMFDIYTSFLIGNRIFVDAQTGLVIKTFSLSPDCTATTVTTNFYGVQGFSTRAVPNTGNPTLFNLWNDCRTAFVRTQHWNSTGMNYSDYISFSNNGWNDQASGATSHWCMEKASDYYFSIHARDGWNAAKAGVFILQDALFCDGNTPCNVNNPNNASFGGGTMLVGNAGTTSTIDDYNSLDIIAHEFTHGVTQTSANLVYSKESGALNESFSDIFGVSCEAWLFGTNSNTWKVGFDRKNPNNTAQSLYVRNMSNPNDTSAVTPSPDTYLSTTLWVSTTTATDVGNDNWGVHTNSGVQNYMYYLLVNGGSGTNDNGTPFSLIGIGISAARDIAYNTLVFYLTSTSQFADARNAWVHAAADLYGQCSLQAIETGKAWAAVGLQPPVINQTTPECGTFGSSIFTLTNPNIFSLAPNCLMTVIPSSLVEFGSNKVIMNPGFRAQTGSHFRAYVSDCRYAAY